MWSAGTSRRDQQIYHQGYQDRTDRRPHPSRSSWRPWGPGIFVADAAGRGFGPCTPTLLRQARALHPRVFEDLPVDELAIDALDAADIDGFDEVARRRIDGDRPARADEVDLLERRHRLVGVDHAVELRHHVADRMHAVIAGHRHEARPGMCAEGGLPVGEVFLVLGARMSR